MAAWNSGEYYEGERIKLHKFLDTVDTSKLSNLGRIEYVKAAALMEIARKMKITYKSQRREVMNKK